jgi:hypothetical protein
MLDLGFIDSQVYDVKPVVEHHEMVVKNKFTDESKEVRSVGAKKSKSGIRKLNYEIQNQSNLKKVLTKRERLDKCALNNEPIENWPKGTTFWVNPLGIIVASNPGARLSSGSYTWQGYYGTWEKGCYFSYDYYPLKREHVEKAMLDDLISDSPNSDVRFCNRPIKRSYDLLAKTTDRNVAILKMYEDIVSKWEKDPEVDLYKLLTAINIASKYHCPQTRKDGTTPYIIHPLGVAISLYEEGQIKDTDVLVAAILHDSLEDTALANNKDLLVKIFGSRVMGIVEEVTDDISLPSHEKKQRQIDHAPHMSYGARLVKLADRLYNVRDCKTSGIWTREKVLTYLSWGDKLLGAMRGTNESLEKALEDELVSQVEGK